MSETAEIMYRLVFAGVAVFAACALAAYARQIRTEYRERSTR